MQVTITVNGEKLTRDVEPRKLLVHFIREDADQYRKFVPGRRTAVLSIARPPRSAADLLLALSCHGISFAPGETYEGPWQDAVIEEEYHLSDETLAALSAAMRATTPDDPDFDPLAFIPTTDVRIVRRVEWQSM